MEVVIVAVVISFLCSLITVFMFRSQICKNKSVDFINDNSDKIIKKLQEIEEILDSETDQFKVSTTTIDNSDLKSYIDQKFNEFRLSMCEIGIDELVKSLKRNQIPEVPKNIKPKKDEPKVEKPDPEVPDKPETSSNSDENDEEEEVNDDGNGEIIQTEKPGESKYDGFLVYLSHKTANQTNFMDCEGNYVEYGSEEANENKFTSIDSAKKEVEDMKNDPDFSDFNIGICAVTNDGAKFLSEEELSKM